jgi:hypothetical protein
VSAREDVAELRHNTLEARSARPQLRSWWLAALILSSVVEVLSAFTSAASNSSASPGCAVSDVSVKVAQGIPHMGGFTLIIRVTNTGQGACELTGFPTVGYLNGSGDQVGTAARSKRPTGVVIRERLLRLDVGEVASSMLSGSDIPVGDAVSCPVYAGYTVSLPGSARFKTFDSALGDCAALTVSPFVLGFNGTSPSGEVLGSAPACRKSSQPSQLLGPAVWVNAWSGRHLSNSITVFPGSHAQPYEMVLSPGRYRIASQGSTTSRFVEVRAGRALSLGTFGDCHAVSTPSTFPLGGSGSPTTTTFPAQS